MPRFRFSLRFLFIVTAWASWCFGVLAAGMRSGDPMLGSLVVMLLTIGGLLGLLAEPSFRGVMVGTIIPASVFGIGMLVNALRHWV
mgnify:CR=1 FL=1